MSTCQKMLPAVLHLASAAVWTIDMESAISIKTPCTPMPIDLPVIAAFAARKAALNLRILTSSSMPQIFCHMAFSAADAAKPCPGQFAGLHWTAHAKVVFEIPADAALHGARLALDSACWAM